jgi:serine/threonine protein kinase
MRMKPGDQLDRFEIIEGLGEGAYAETYKARDTKSGQIVLIKSPNPLLFADPGIHQRFMREAEIARHLNHPGVQRSIDLGERRSEPYLAMEYIEGDTLRKWLRSHSGPMPIAQAIQWGRELAEALAYLHAHKIVHRDLKPENIIVTGGDAGAGGGHLKIIDFGTALLEGARRLTWRHLTEALGTPDYMSPEQIQGERGDQRSDVYALGIMLYEFLTGHVPFEGDNYLAVMAGHLQRDPKRIRSIRPEVPEDLENVVLSAMRRYPENRYQTADELLADLNALQIAPAPAAPAPAPPPTPAHPTPAHPAPAPVLASPAAAAPAGSSQVVRPAVPAFGSSRPASAPAPLPAHPLAPAPGRPAAPVAGGPPLSHRLPPPLAAGSPPPRLGPGARDLSPEKPIGRLPAPASTRDLWLFVAKIAGGFIGVVALVIVLSVLLH